MARVAMQLGRLSLLDQPLGMSVNGLDFYTSRGPSAHSISATTTIPSVASSSMGTNHTAQPSLEEPSPDENEQTQPEQARNLRSFDIFSGLVSLGMRVSSTPCPLRTRLLRTRNMGRDSPVSCGCLKAPLKA